MQDKVYLISYVGDGVFQGKSIIGFISEFDTELIARIVKERSNLTLGEKYPAKFTFEKGLHWEFATDKDVVDVHVDAVYRLWVSNINWTITAVKSDWLIGKTIIKKLNIKVKVESEFT